MLLDRIRAHGEADPERVALDPAGAAPLTYRELAGQVMESASRFRDDDDPGRPVVLQLDHGLNSAVLELALLEAEVPVRPG